MDRYLFVGRNHLSRDDRLDAIDRSEAILKAEKDAFVSAEKLCAGNYSPQFLRAIDNGLQFSEKKRPQSVEEWRQQLGIDRNGQHSYSQLATQIYDDEELYSKTQFEPPSTPPEPISERQIETQIATRPQGESLEPNELPQVPNSQGQVDVPTSPGSQTFTAPHKSWVKPMLTGVLGLAVLLLIAAGVTGPAGFVDNIKGRLASLSGQQESVQSLVAKGDRALAAGKVYAPFEGSALDYYRRAATLEPNNTAARQGIELTAPEVKKALEISLADGKLETADKYFALLDSLPYKPFELSNIAQAINDKRTEAAAAERESQRIKDFLRATKSQRL